MSHSGATFFFPCRPSSPDRTPQRAHPTWRAPVLKDIPAGRGHSPCNDHFTRSTGSSAHLSEDIPMRGQGQIASQRTSSLPAVPNPQPRSRARLVGHNKSSPDEALSPPGLDQPGRPGLALVAPRRRVLGEVVQHAVQEPAPRHRPHRGSLDQLTDRQRDNPREPRASVQRHHGRNGPTIAKGGSCRIDRRHSITQAYGPFKGLE
jgi:hypothetical protein